MKMGVVMVVDDIDITRVMIKSLISDICYVVQASSGNEALNLILKMERPPDLIILDLIMQGMSGLEFMDLLRGMPEYSGMPIMVVTGMQDKHYETRAISLGAVDFIMKPFNADTLKMRVKNNLELVKLRKNEPLLARLSDNLLETLARVIENAKTGAGLPDADTRISELRRKAEVTVHNLLENSKYYKMLSSEDYKSIANAMPVHDIGMIGIPENILQKPGKLTSDEFETVKTHTVIGAGIVKRIINENGETDYLKTCFDICRFHHERWDGKGYPDGLTAESIPLSARINSLLDTYDALTRDKPYRKAANHLEAVDILAAGRGSQFDPYLIDGFMEIHKQL